MLVRTEGSEVRILSPRPEIGPLLTVMVGRGPSCFPARLKRRDNLCTAQVTAPGLSTVAGRARASTADFGRWVYAVLMLNEPGRPRWHWANSRA
jgi:hypothetical protein